MISQVLQLHETSIVRHIDDFISKDKLASANDGSQSYLSQTQIGDVVAHITLNTYCCSYEIIEYMWKTHEIRFYTSDVNKWLHNHDFTYKYPKGVPHKYDEEKQADFIEKYTELKAEVVDESTLFMDAIHPSDKSKLWLDKKDMIKRLEPPEAAHD